MGISPHLLRGEGATLDWTLTSVPPLCTKPVRWYHWILAETNCLFAETMKKCGILRQPGGVGGLWSGSCTRGVIMITFMQAHMSFLVSIWSALFGTLVTASCLHLSTHCCSQSWCPAAKLQRVCTSAEHERAVSLGAGGAAQRLSGQPGRDWNQPGSCVRQGSRSAQPPAPPPRLSAARSQTQRLQKKRANGRTPLPANSQMTATDACNEKMKFHNIKTKLASRWW